MPALLAINLKTDQTILDQETYFLTNYSQNSRITEKIGIQKLLK